MEEYIKREDALAFPFANGQYDHENADEHFIFGCETYKEWLEQVPAADVVERRSCDTCQYYEGVHHAFGHAPCSFWKIGGVMWNDFCSRWEKENG